MIASYEIQLSVLLLFTFAYWPWQWFILDLFRQRLFVIRDKAFLTAVKKETLNTSDYRIFRNRINNMIRYAHCISWWRVCLFSVFSKDLGAPEVVETISNHQLKKEYEKAMHIALLLLIARSPILMIITMFFIPFFILSVLFSSMTINSAWRVIKKSEIAVFNDIKFSGKAHC